MKCLLAYRIQLSRLLAWKKRTVFVIRKESNACPRKSIPRNEKKIQWNHQRRTLTWFLAERKCYKIFCEWDNSAGTFHNQYNTLTENIQTNLIRRVKTSEQKTSTRSGAYVGYSSRSPTESERTFWYT